MKSTYVHTIPVPMINRQLTVFFAMCCFFIDRSCSDETWLFKADLVWWVAWKAKPSREISKSPVLWIAMSLIHNSLGMLKKHCTTFGLFSCQTEILPKNGKKKGNFEYEHASYESSILAFKINRKTLQHFLKPFFHLPCCKLRKF